MLKIQCITFYFSRYLARKLSKKTKCQLCSSGIKNNDSIDNNLAAAKLTNLKSRGYLTQEDSGFYILLRQLKIHLLLMLKAQMLLMILLTIFLTTII